MDDSDDEDSCALSDKWRYQRSSRRWSRKDLEDIIVADAVENSLTVTSGIRLCSSHDSVITDNEESLTSQQEESPTLETRTRHNAPSELCHNAPGELFVLELGPGEVSPSSAHNTSLTSGHVSDSDNSYTGSLEPPMSPTAFKRSASEKFKSARHTFFRRMESLKSRKGSSSVRGKPKVAMGKIEIGSPVLVETKSIQERMDKLGCKEISPSIETSPNLSTSSRNTNTSGAHDLTMDNDSVFLDNDVKSLKGVSQVTCDVREGELIRRNLSESAVVELMAHSRERLDDSSPPVTNGYLEPEDDSRNYRTGSFSFGCHGENDDSFNDTDPMSISFQDNMLESNNNEKNIKLRDRHGSSADNRLSVYDNVPDDECDAVKELDMIVQSLMQDINDLNATWGMTQSGQ